MSASNDAFAAYEHNPGYFDYPAQSLLPDGHSNRPDNQSPAEYNNRSTLWNITVFQLSPAEDWSHLLPCLLLKEDRISLLQSY